MQDENDHTVVHNDEIKTPSKVDVQNFLQVSLRVRDHCHRVDSVHRGFVPDEISAPDSLC